MDLRDKYGVNKNIYSEVTCPVCGRPTLDNFWICENCNWEEDGTTDENEYSSANRGTIREYKEKLGLLKNPNVRFNIFPENISDFTKCIALLEREIGAIGFDMEDFNRIVSGSQRVDFFTELGDDLKAVTFEFIKYLRDDFGKSKIKMLYVVTANEPPSSEAYEQFVAILKDAFEPHVFCHNIYHREQKEKYKAYLFVAQFD